MMKLCRRSVLSFAFLLGASTLGLQAADKKEVVATAAPSFTGTWLFRLEASSFMLELVQTGDKVEGYHNSVTNGGRRLDTVLKDDGIPSVSGTVANGVATVKFKSGYGDGTGEAVMKIVKGELDWTIKTSKGEHYFPSECSMKRLKEKTKAEKK